MGRIAVDAPDLRLHRHVMPRYAYPPRPVDDRAPQRARRLKADEQYGRFTPAEIVAQVMTDAARLAHARCGEDDRARQVVEPHRFSGAAHEMKGRMRSEEHTSELQSLMRISYAVFCLKKK